MFQPKQEIFKLFVNLASHALKSSININGFIKFLDLWTKLFLPYHDSEEIQQYLLYMEEQYDYFVKVYGYVITIKDIPKE